MCGIFFRLVYLLKANLTNRQLNAQYVITKGDDWLVALRKIREICK